MTSSPPNIETTSAGQNYQHASLQPGRPQYSASDAGHEPVQLALFPEQVSLIRLRPEHNEKRYYQIEIVTDLFGAVGLVRTWGRIGRSAHSRFNPLPDLGTAIDILHRLARTKRHRGYQDR
ncbi:WGR domain-containing protein [Acidiphilium sp. PM]|uniref:WGR domain-containing protein n=1 Tax=Acidiphilium sp. PM TaxID=1043206 RepID=UPI001F52A262|nr:WGR domain-containing protein [Acidiphilium sp. PM]